MMNTKIHDANPYPTGTPSYDNHVRHTLQQLVAILTNQSTPFVIAQQVDAVTTLDELTFSIGRSVIDSHYSLYMMLLSTINGLYQKGSLNDLETTYNYRALRALAIACEKSSILKSRMVPLLPGICTVAIYYVHLIRRMASIPELILRSPSNTAATSGYNLQQLPTV
ncbi:hypothetical protein SeLEV6574_g05598 [Synchytrium endobioticum]|nr:hypothetical protein SeLEV6574_g05598 [Synchytrium endobioticum]